MRFVDLSIKTKVITIILVGVSSAISVGLTYFIVLDSKSLYRDLEEELLILTQITAKRSSAALSFLDTERAQENLHHLEIHDSIQSGCIYSIGGELFSAYEKNNEAKYSCPKAMSEQLKTQRFLSDRIVIAESIDNKSQKVGDIVIVSDRSRIEAKRRDWIVLSLTMALAGLAVVGVMTNRMQSSIVNPLKNLTKIMDRVRSTNDLRLRADSPGNDELGSLVDAFNEMLAIMESNANDLNQIYEDLINKSMEAEDSAIELESRNEQIKGMLSGAAHDLRQPLQAMSIFVDVLDAETLPDNQRNIVTKMQKTVDNLSTMFKEILDFSRLDHEQRVADRVALNTMEFFENLQVEFDVLAQNKGLHYRQHIKDLQLHTVPAVLERVVRNLISNAVRYTDEGGILVAVRERKAAVWVEVWDTGIGIPEEKQNEMLKKFVAADNQGRDRKGSYGLGLAIVEHLVELLGASLKIKSRPGRGSCFRICLPKHDKRKVVENARKAEVEPKKGVESLSAAKTSRKKKYKPKVYLIDDEDEPRELLSALLNMIGAQVFAFSGIEELKHYFSTSSIVEPDVVISDYQVGASVTGDQIIEEIRKNIKGNVPAFIVTGNQSDEIHDEIEGKGFEFLLKPVKLQDLKLKLRSFTTI